MKVSSYAIRRFKSICMNEQTTDDETVKYKLTRDFELGTFLINLDQDIYISAFGTLRIKAFKDEIIDVWRGRRNYPVSTYTKYKYDFEHNRVEKYTYAGEPNAKSECC